MSQSRKSEGRKGLGARMVICEFGEMLLSENFEPRPEGGFQNCGTTKRGLACSYFFLNCKLFGAGW